MSSVLFFQPKTVFASSPSRQFLAQNGTFPHENAKRLPALDEFGKIQAKAKVSMMRQWWVKLVVAVVIIVLLAFAGVKLYQTMLGLLGVVASGGEADLPGQEDPLEDSMWTQPPYVADDSAYDDVSAVREYEDAGE